MNIDVFVSLISFFGHLASLISPDVKEFRETTPHIKYASVIVADEEHGWYAEIEDEVIQLDTHKWIFKTGSVLLDGRYFLGLGYGERSKILLWWTDKISA